jgi:hypothetical protein
MKQNRKAHRFGTTLVEVIWAIAVMALGVNVAILSWTSLRRACNDHEQQLADLHTRLDLAAQLRAHAARGLLAKVADDGKSLTLEIGPGSEIKYSIQENAIRWEESQNGVWLRGDFFRLSAADSYRFSLTTGLRPLVKLETTKIADDSLPERDIHSPQAGISILTLVGADSALHVARGEKQP